MTDRSLVTDYRVRGGTSNSVFCNGTRIHRHSGKVRKIPRAIPILTFDLVLDRDLPYSEVLSLSQGWINKVKRSLPSHP